MKIEKILLRPSFYLSLSAKDCSLLSCLARVHSNRLTPTMRSAINRVEALDNACKIKPGCSAPFTGAELGGLSTLLEDESALENKDLRAHARLLRGELDAMLRAHPVQNVTGGDTPKGRTGEELNSGDLAAAMIRG
jgi:hypothetical protein